MTPLLGRIKQGDAPDPLARRIGQGSRIAIFDTVMTGPNTLLYLFVNEWGDVGALDAVVEVLGGLPPEWTVADLRQTVADRLLS